MPRSLVLLSLVCLLSVACSRETPPPEPSPPTAEPAAVAERPAGDSRESTIAAKPMAGTPVAGTPVAGTPVPASGNTTIAVLDISERNNEGKNGIAVTFSREVDASVDIQPYLSVTLADGSPVAGAWVLSENRKLAWFMNTEPNTGYQIKVSPGLKAANQSRLLAAASDTLTTRRLLPSVNFASDGMVLPVGYVSGLPVVTVNIDAVDVDFFRIEDEHISDFMARIRSYGRSSWYVRNLKDLGALVYSGRFDLNAPTNTRSKRDLDVQSIDQLQQSGLYLAVMRPAGEYNDLETTWFTITDIGLHLRQYRSQLDVHAASLTSGKPLADVSLEILDSENRVTATATTTPEGQASFTGDQQKGQVLVARKGNQITLLDLRQPALDLAEFDLGARPQLANELFIYGPRDLYRPGETVAVSALLRDRDGRLDQAPVLTAEIRNPLGSTVKSFKWQAQSLGYYAYQYTLPDNATVGRWTLVVNGILEKPVVYPINVEEFLPERMKLTLADGQARTLVTSASETPRIAVLGEYLYGAPAEGNKFDALLQISHWRSPLVDLKGYQFGDLLDTQFSRQQDLDEVTLDPEGKTQLNIPNRWHNVHSPLEVRVVGSLYETGGRAVTRAHPILVWPNTLQPGIRPQFGDRNPEPGSNAGFDIVLARVDGTLVAADGLEATLIKEDRQYFWEYNQHNGWHWDWSEKEFPVAVETLATSDSGAVSVVFPVEWGRYRLEVVDTATNVKTSVRFFAGYDWYYDWKNADQQAAARPDKINLALDKPAYAAGETAQLKILPPAAGEVVVLVEGDMPLWSTKLSVGEAGAVVDIPIDAAWDQHNLYVSALLVQPSGKALKQTPKRALGLIHLPLDREQRRLQVELNAPETVLPATDLVTKVQVTAAGAMPGEVMLTLAAVDVGVLSITDFATPDPFEHFFGQRRYTVDAWDMFADVIEVQQAEKARQRFGGDADLVRGGDRPKSDVQIVSLFQGPVTLDADGKAEISLTLPDFNGRLRLMAVAFSDAAFGSADTEVTVSAPIIAEIAMPRFLAMGDQSQLALDLRNNTDVPVDLTVDLSATAPLKLSGDSPSFSLTPNQRVTLRVPVIADGYSGSGTITARIRSQQVEDFSRSWQLGVRPAYPAISQKIERVLAAGETFAITAEDLPAVILETLQSSVSVTPVVNLQIREQIKNLLSYPYGCLEQTASRAWPLTYASQEQQRAFGMTPMDDQERFRRIQEAVDRILSFQRSNGSFGLWGPDSDEEHWLTVYATDFLLRAQEQGMDVPKKQLDRALERLGRYLSGSGTFVHQRWSREPDHYAFATRAYAGYVLGRLQRAPLGVLRNIYRRDFSKAESGYAQLHLALALLAMGDKGNGEEAARKALYNFGGEYKYLGDYGSKVRDIGMAIALLAAEDAYRERVLNLSLELRDAMADRRWFSTQERFALFMAGMSLEQNAGSSWQGKWQLGSADSHDLKQSAGWQRGFDGDQLQQGLVFTSRHDGPLYASAVITGYGVEAPTPVAEGIDIERHWYTLAGEPAKLDNVKSGERYLVHIRLSGGKRVADALVVNLLPSGFELENENLNTALDFESLTLDGKSLKSLRQQTDVKHREYLDDRFVAAINHVGYNSSHVFFVVRAVTPGVYQVPPPLVEDMYRPEIHALGETLEQITIQP